MISSGGGNLPSSTRRSTVRVLIPSRLATSAFVSRSRARPNTAVSSASSRTRMVSRRSLLMLVVQVMLGQTLTSFGQGSQRGGRRAGGTTSKIVPTLFSRRPDVTDLLGQRGVLHVLSVRKSDEPLHRGVFLQPVRDLAVLGLGAITTVFGDCGHDLVWQLRLPVARVGPGLPTKRAPPFQEPVLGILPHERGLYHLRWRIRWRARRRDLLGQGELSLVRDDRRPQYLLGRPRPEPQCGHLRRPAFARRIGTTVAAGGRTISSTIRASASKACRFSDS